MDEVVADIAKHQRRDGRHSVRRVHLDLESRIHQCQGILYQNVNEIVTVFLLAKYKKSIETSNCISRYTFLLNFLVTLNAHSIEE